MQVVAAASTLEQPGDRPIVSDGKDERSHRAKPDEGKGASTRDAALATSQANRPGGWPPLLRHRDRPRQRAPEHADEAHTRDEPGCCKAGVVEAARAGVET